MKKVNAVVTKADVRFFPELDKSQIELRLQYDMGNALLRAPMNSKSLYSILNVFGKDSVDELNGQYCRVLMDEQTGRVDSVMNIIYDDLGELQDNPVA